MSQQPRQPTTVPTQGRDQPTQVPRATHIRTKTGACQAKGQNPRPLRTWEQAWNVCDVQVASATIISSAATDEVLQVL
jgi:hypothetical protein